MIEEIEHTEEDELNNLKKSLIDACTIYNNAPAHFKIHNLCAKHVIRELNILDTYCERLDPSIALTFKKMVLQCYVIALQEYLRKGSSRLRNNIDSVVKAEKDILPTSCEAIKKSYETEIDDIKKTFSSASFSVGSYYDALYKAYLKKNFVFQYNAISKKDNAASQVKPIKDNKDDLIDDEFFEITYSPNYEHDFLDNAKNELIVSCADYINYPDFSFKGNKLPAEHVIKELNSLDDYSKNIDPSNVFAFKQMVLQCYVIALQEHLNKDSRSRLLKLITEFVEDKKKLLTNHEEIKSSYRKEINQIKFYFSNFTFRHGDFAYSLDGGCYVLSAAFLKKNPNSIVNQREGVELKEGSAASQKKSDVVSEDVSSENENLTGGKPDEIPYSPDYELNDKNDLLDQARNALITSCTTYINNRGFFTNSNDTLAREVIKELGYLDDISKRLEPIHAIAFKQVVLQCYMTALQEYLPKDNKLLESIMKVFSDENLVDAVTTNCSDVNQSYRKQIEFIKHLFSSVNLVVHKINGSFPGCCDALYLAYRKKHPDSTISRREGFELNNVKNNMKKV